MTRQSRQLSVYIDRREDFRLARRERIPRHLQRRHRQGLSAIALTSSTVRANWTGSWNRHRSRTSWSMPRRRRSAPPPKRWWRRSTG